MQNRVWWHRKSCSAWVRQQTVTVLTLFLASVNLSAFLTSSTKKSGILFFLKEDWIHRQLAPFREWSEEEFFPEALALNPTYFQWELDVACLKIPTCYLLILYQGPQNPRNLEFTCVPQHLRVHWSQQKGFQLAVCPYGAEFVQCLI